MYTELCAVNVYRYWLDRTYIKIHIYISIYILCINMFRERILLIYYYYSGQHDIVRNDFVWKKGSNRLHARVGTVFRRVIRTVRGSLTWFRTKKYTHLIKELITDVNAALYFRVGTDIELCIILSLLLFLVLLWYFFCNLQYHGKCIFSHMF